MNYATQFGAQPIPDPKKRGRKRTLKSEDAFASLIKEGLVKVVRRRGKPPLIVWLQ